MSSSTLRRFLVLAVLAQVSVAGASGSVSGVIGFEGPAPKREKLQRASDPVCAKTEAYDPTVTVSKDGKALANVMVRLVNAPAGGVAPTGPVVVDQDGCMYLPRVQGAVEGQKITVRNGDPTLHNVHAFQGTRTLWNQAQPPKARNIEKSVKDVDVVKLKCDVHPWMAGYVLIHKHPYFSVSDGEGKFEIKDVPPGAYTVEAWHEKYGTKQAQVTVEEGKAAEAKFTFSEKKP